MKETRIAKNFIKLKKAKPIVYWELRKWVEGGLLVKDIQALLRRRGISISYWSTWYWKEKIKAKILEDKKIFDWKNPASK